MNLSIAQKLVVAFLGLTLLVLTATLGLARWSFEQGFLDYVNAVEQTRLEQVQDDLVEEYLSSGRNWESLNPQRFASLVRRSAPRESRNRPRPGGMPPPPPRNSHRPPPPGGEPGPPPRGNASAPPTALYDPDNQLIAGVGTAIEGANAIRVAIVVDGATVGELRGEPRRRLSSPLETAFSRQQLTTSWVIGLSCLLLAFGLSLLLARGLLAPVRRMISNVARLSQGDYSQRLVENRRDELGQLSSDLNRLGMTLEESRSSRQRFLADVSHELRTPLTVLSGEIEALKDGLRSFDANQLESLDQEVQRLRYLVDDLYELSVSDVGGLRYQFTTTKLEQCLEAAVSSTRKRASEQGIEIVLNSTVSVPVMADSQRINQLLLNLLQNSLAYTDAPGRIELTLSRAGATALISIEDTAPGVNPDDCDKLFEPLFRHEASRSRRTGGAGLGLAICRNIVEAHGGAISASPSVLGGLSIHIQIPAVSEGTA